MPYSTEYSLNSLPLLIPHFYLLFTVHTFYGIYILKQMTFSKISVWFFFFYSVWSTYVAFHEIMVATDPGHSNVTWGNLNIWFTGQSVYFQHRRKERFFFTWKVSVFRRLNKSVNESDLMQKKRKTSVVIKLALIVYPLLCLS